MFAHSLLLLFAGLFFHFTGIHDELIFHYNGHVTDTEFWFFRLNKAQLNHVIFMLKFFFLFFSFQFFLLVFGQVHWHDDVLIFGSILFTDLLESDLISQFKNIDVVLNFQGLDFFLKIFVFKAQSSVFEQDLIRLNIVKQGLVPPFNWRYLTIIPQSGSAPFLNDQPLPFISLFKNVWKAQNLFNFNLISQSWYRLVRTFFQKLQAESWSLYSAFIASHNNKVAILELFW